MKRVGWLALLSIALPVFQATPASANRDWPDIGFFYEDSGPLMIAKGLRIRPLFGLDPDDTVTGARVRITRNFRRSQDSFITVAEDFSAPGLRTIAAGITSNYNDSTGTLTFRGEGSASEYQRALRSVAYENSSDDPSPLTRKVALSLVGSGFIENVVARNGFRIKPVDDAPELRASEGDTHITWKPSQPTVVDGGMRVRDVDDDNLEGATIQIYSGFENGDVLGLVNGQLPPGITGTYNSGTGVLTLTGSASVADYQSALRSVTYDNTGSSKPSSPKIVAFANGAGATINEKATTKTITIS